eukprot:7277218-Pyramimonas_sp.AAC.1
MGGDEVGGDTRGAADSKREAAKPSEWPNPMQLRVTQDMALSSCVVCHYRGGAWGSADGERRTRRADAS